MKDYVLCLIVVALGMQVVVAGCRHIVPAVDAARQYQQWREEKKAAERAEAERIEQERAEKEAAAIAEKEAAEQAAYEAALAPPHPPGNRQSAYDAWKEYVAAGEKPAIITDDNASEYLMLWKTPAHSLRETVILLGRYWLGRGVARILVAADPQGREVIVEGRIVAPYEAKHPAAYLPQLGQAYRPGPVFVVGYDAAGNRLFVYAVGDPGMRTGALQ